MTFEEYFHQMMENLQSISRTTTGVVDTSASSTKKSVMAVTSGDTAKALARRNEERAFGFAWENRYRVFSDTEDLQRFIENLAREVNREILKEEYLYRQGADSVKYPYVPVAKIEESVAWFYDFLFELLCKDPYDALETAAAAEFYINFTIHPFADGCGRTSMVTASWLLMRGNHALPVYPPRDDYYGFRKMVEYAPAGTEENLNQLEAFRDFYGSLFPDDDESGSGCGVMTILLPEKITSDNAEKVKAQIFSILHAAGAEEVILDATALQYISSAGLRTLLALGKGNKKTSVCNVSESVYEILDLSGFTTIMRVDRRMREISLAGCEMIGQGQNGTVYRYSADTIVKVYNEKNQLKDVRQEHEMSRFCFVSGLPTAIPLNLVLADGRIGAMYELLNAQSFAHEFLVKPEQREKMIEQYIALMKQIHAIVPQMQSLPKNIDLPDKKEMYLTWISDIEKELEPETYGELCRIISEDIPDTDTLVHGDLHPLNLMIAEDELFLIDLADLGVGDPVFDLVNIVASLGGFQKLGVRDICEWNNPELQKWTREKILSGYYADLPERERERKIELVYLCMHIRLSRYGIRHDFISEQNTKEELRKLHEFVHSYH